jgi:hypothetical protein
MPKNQKRGLRQYGMLPVEKSYLGLWPHRNRVRDGRYSMREFLLGSNVLSLNLLQGGDLL